MGLTIPYFKRDEKIRDEITLLNIKHKGELIQGALISRTLVEISSYPCEFFCHKE
jgi:hypothetical protein